MYTERGAMPPIKQSGTGDAMNISTISATSRRPTVTATTGAGNNNNTLANRKSPHQQTNTGIGGGSQQIRKRMDGGANQHQVEYDQND